MSSRTMMSSRSTSGLNPHVDYRLALDAANSKAAGTPPALEATRYAAEFPRGQLHVTQAAKAAAAAAAAKSAALHAPAVAKSAMIGTALGPDGMPCRNGGVKAFPRPPCPAVPACVTAGPKGAGPLHDAQWSNY